MKKIFFIILIITFSQYLYCQEYAQKKDSTVSRNLKTYNPFGYQYVAAPTGFAMKKGETYYGTYGLFMHRFQHGYSDQFTMSFGFGFPGVMLMANYSIPINKYSVFSIHDAIIAIYYGSRYGNWTYAQYTFGNQFNSISLGTGFLIGSYLGNSPISPTVNLSGQIRLTKSIYLMHETYYFNIYDERHYMQVADNSIGMVKKQRSTNFAGLTCLNFIFEKKTYNSLKIGAAYNYAIQGNIPVGYEYSDTYQQKEEIGGWALLIYSRKFRMKK